MPALIVDTDGAADDAAALLLAGRSPDLVAVTVTGGVVPVDRAVANALAILDVAGRPDVAVFSGADSSLTGAGFEGAEDVHGPGGLGGHPVSSRRSPESEPAAAAIDRLTRSGPTTIITLGPLTNLATALALGAGLAQRSVRVVAMAGAQDAVGNVTAVAEYNVAADPEAAAAVLASGLDVTLVGWDVSRRDAVIGDDDRRRLAAVGTERARFLDLVTVGLDRFCREEQGLPGYDLPDAAAAAVALDPSVVLRAGRAAVAVELRGQWTRGMTVVDHRRGAFTTATVVWAIDHGRFVDLLAAALAP